MVRKRRMRQLASVPGSTPIPIPTEAFLELNPELEQYIKQQPLAYGAAPVYPQPPRPKYSAYHQYATHPKYSYYINWGWYPRLWYYPPVWFPF